MCCLFFVDVCRALGVVVECACMFGECCRLPLAVADCCMSCTDCCVVANCGRARHWLLLYCIVFVCVLWMSCIM